MNRRRSLGRARIAGLSSLALAAGCLVPLPFLAGCGSHASTYNPSSADGGSGSSGGSSGSGGSKGGGSSGGSSGGGRSGGSSGGASGGGSSGGGDNEGDGGGPAVPPPEVTPKLTCNSNTTDSPATTLSFTNNLMPSPAPPGNLTPQNAPQIIVVGWDDIESGPGLQFVTSLLGSVKNPAENPNSHLTAATANMNANSCYSNPPAAAGTVVGVNEYACGDGTLAADPSLVSSLVTSGWTLANHTMDHLENYEPAPGWAGIPTAWHDPVNNGWLGCSSGPAASVCTGPGCCLDEATWQTILPINQSQLMTNYGATTIQGFRAPSLEMNDNGLNALKAISYQYDSSLEEIQPAGWVSAAVDADTTNGQGFNWFPWPYTLDNGSPGIWNQQAGGSQQWITNFPTALWEVPTYEVYVPSAGNLGTTIANKMIAANKACTYPYGTPADQEQNCYLSPGELSPGDAETEITGFDFNLFIYCLMTQQEWLQVMQHTFLLRYNGSRTPLAYGSHPIEYTQPYDSYTLGSPGCNTGTSATGVATPCTYSAGNPENCCQANNYGYRDVTMYSTYLQRQAAMQAFVQWIESDPNYSKDTYFMSMQDLVTYMQKPFDKTGAPVQPDTVASPDSNGIFNRLGWTTQGATFSAVSGNSANLSFTIAPLDAAGDTPDVSYVEAGVAAGSLQNLSHIDIEYTTEVPFRIRLLTSDGSTTATALLAGVGGNRTARIRIKDFFPGPEVAESQVSNMSLVDSAYMAKVTGIAFESAATTAAPSGTPGNFPGGTFTTKIQQITLHGVATASLCSP